MIRSLQTVAVLAGILVTAPAGAGELPSFAAPYASFFAGASQPSATVSISAVDAPGSIGFGFDLDTGYIIGGTVGATVLPSLRGEVEFSVIKATVSDFFDMSDEQAQTTGYNVLGNLWYDLDTGSSFTPYFGGGLGWGYDVITAEGGDGELNTSGALYQLGFGVRIAATDRIGFDLGYRYRVQPDATLSGSEDLDDASYEVKSSATNHIVQAGITVGF